MAPKRGKLVGQHAANQLRELRALLGMSQRDLAKEFGVTHGAISQWESGERDVPGPILRLIEIYSANLGIVGDGTTGSVKSDWASRTLRSSIATGKIATRLMGRSLATLVAGNETAAQLKAASDSAIIAEITEALAELRGLSAKIGQMVGLMDFALPTDMRDSLLSLTDQCVAMPTSDMRRVFRDEFGREPERMFKEWSDVPFAAGSLGQVHRAKLFSGENVAVKVQYPGIVQALISDLRNMGRLEQLLGFLFRYQEPGTLVSELRERLLEECDYEVEAKNLETFRALLAESPDVLVPKVYKKLSGKTVLTMDLMNGASFTYLRDSGTQAEKNAFGELLFKINFQLIFKHGIFNCDPSAGNVLWTGEKLILLDLGCVKQFDTDFIANYRQLAHATVAKDQAVIKKILLKTGFLPRPDKTEFAHAALVLSAIYEPWIDDCVWKFTPQYLQKTWLSMAENPEKYKFAIPKDWLFTFRLQWGVCGLLTSLGAEANWHQLFLAALNEPNKKNGKLAVGG